MEKELLQRFDKFVEALGDMGGHVYDLAVKQAMVDGFTDLATAVAFLLGIAAVWLMRRTFLRKCDTDSMAYEEDKTISFVLCGIVSVVAGVIAVATMLGGIRRLVNPEWYALQEIAKSLGLQ